ncbi:MAG TPA: hypothetical protein VNH83_16685 [Bryobacteraceae bacterium]|nr:hypothetical protein [Bryobacteraceae bacterium]
MEEKQRIEKGDVGRLEDVLGGGDPLLQKAPTAAPGAEKDPFKGRWVTCNANASPHVYDAEHECYGVIQLVPSPAEQAKSAREVAPGANARLSGTVVQLLQAVAYRECPFCTGSTRTGHSTHCLMRKILDELCAAPVAADAQREVVVETANLAQSTMLAMIGLAASGRCMACSWPLAESADKGCVQGNCSYRPQNGSHDYQTWRTRTEILTLARTFFAGESNHDDVQDAAAGER